MDLEPLSAKACERATDPDTTMNLVGVISPIKLSVRARDFLGVHRFTFLRNGLTETASKCIHQLMSADLDQPTAEIFKVFVRVDLDIGAAIDSTSVELLVKGHQANPGVRVPGKNCSFDRCCPTPARQQRKMDVDEGQLCKQRARDDASVGHHNREVSVDVHKSGKIISDWQPELTRRGLYRRRGEFFTSAASSVRTRNDERNAVAGLVQSEKGRDSKRGGAEIDDPRDVRRWRDAHGSRSSFFAGEAA